MDARDFDHARIIPDDEGFLPLQSVRDLEEPDGFSHPLVLSMAPLY